VLLEIF